MVETKTPNPAPIVPEPKKADIKPPVVKADKMNRHSLIFDRR